MKARKTYKLFYAFVLLFWQNIHIDQSTLSYVDLEVLSTFAFLASCGSSSESAISNILKEENYLSQFYRQKFSSVTKANTPGNSLHIQYMYIWKKVIYNQIHVLNINGSVYIGWL